MLTSIITNRALPVRGGRHYSTRLSPPLPGPALSASSGVPDSRQSQASGLSGLVMSSVMASAGDFSEKSTSLTAWVIGISTL